MASNIEIGDLVLLAEGYYTELLAQYLEELRDGGSCSHTLEKLQRLNRLIRALSWDIGEERNDAYTTALYECLYELLGGEGSVLDIDPAVVITYPLVVTGTPGPQGIQGVPGPMGPAGPAGETGAIGPEGPQGVQGVEGPRGEAGDPGETGLTGAEGPQGIQGIAGEPGPAGATGPQGDTGPAGPQGIQGIQGNTGDTGATGAAGLDGATGPQGIQGIAGDPGPAGATGPTGPTGPEGPQGIQGEDGQIILAGDFTNLESGDGPPTVGIGTDGDFYLDTTNYILYGPKAGGAWPAVGINLIGPAGPQGIQGPAGATGATGAAGPAGETGPQGIQGIQGIQGDQGPAGTDGLDGAPGIQGPQGLQGPAGDAGATGATGATGETGATGPQGIQGPAGDAGATGLTGPEGPIGPEGQQGLQGIQGIQGPAGIGVPPGGTAGQVLAKVDGDDYDTQWVNQTGGTGTQTNRFQEIFFVDPADVVIARDTTDFNGTRQFYSKSGVLLFSLTEEEDTGGPEPPVTAAALDIPYTINNVETLNLQVSFLNPQSQSLGSFSSGSGLIGAGGLKPLSGELMSVNLSTTAAWTEPVDLRLTIRKDGAIYDSFLAIYATAPPAGILATKFIQPTEFNTWSFEVTIVTTVIDTRSDVDTPPVAVISKSLVGGTETITGGFANVFLFGEDSNDPDGDAISEYLWTTTDPDAVFATGTATTPNIELRFNTPGTKTVTLSVKSKTLYNEKTIQIVISPEVIAVSSYTANNIADAIEADGGTVDRAILTASFNALPTYIKQRASMFSMIPTASKVGKYYSFDNRPNTGVAMPHTFTRGTQATAMNDDDMIWTYQIDEPVFEYTNAYPAYEQSVIDSILANPNRKYVVDYLPSGYVTNGTVNYGAQFNTALDAGLDVIMPDFPIMVNNNSYSMNNGQRILFQANSELRIQTGLNGVNYNILNLTGKDNITVVNAKVRGDKGYGGLSALSYERGQGIALGGASNIVLINPHVTDCWGDGIYLNYYQPTGDCENVHIYNALLRNNGRNNISITNGYNIYLHEPLLIAANKSNPVAGLDIEPNSGTVMAQNIKKLTNIFVYNPITWDNHWSGIQISCGQRYDDGDAIQAMDIYIQNHFSDNECFAMWLSWSRAGRPRNLSGTTTFLNSSFNNARVYSAPPGGGNATTSQPVQDGDKLIIRHTINDAMMTMKFHHPKINCNGVQYTNAQLLDFFATDLNNFSTIEEVIVP